MLQRNSSPLRASTLVLTIAIVLSSVTPCHVAAQAVRAETQAPTIAPAVPARPMPPTAPTPPVAPPHPVPAPPPSVIPPAPPEAPTPPHPVNKDIGTRGDGDHVYALIDDGTTTNTAGDAEGLSASKSQQRKQRTLAGKQQERGRRQWATSERLRVANEAARREADRMINSASPMDWRNRYSSD